MYRTQGYWRDLELITYSRNLHTSYYQNNCMSTGTSLLIGFYNLEYRHTFITTYRECNFYSASNAFYHLHQTHSITFTKPILSPAPKPFYHMHQNKSINWILQSKSFCYLHQNHSFTCTKIILSPAPKQFYHLHQNHAVTCPKTMLSPAPK